MTTHHAVVGGGILGVAVARDVGGDRLQPEGVADRLRQERLVLDDQYAHPPMVGSGHLSPPYRNLRTP